MIYYNQIIVIDELINRFVTKLIQSTFIPVNADAGMEFLVSLRYGN